ncbi:MAG: hypothetical protein PVI20_09840 [Desulfobacteraceae bacterium]|jgi:hypothetical protein
MKYVIRGIFKIHSLIPEWIKVGLGLFFFIGTITILVGAEAEELHVALRWSLGLLAIIGFIIIAFILILITDGLEKLTGKLKAWAFRNNT